VVEENPVGSVHVVSLPVVLGDPESVQLGRGCTQSRHGVSPGTVGAVTAATVGRGELTVGGARVEGGGLALRDLLHLPVELRGGSLALTSGDLSVSNIDKACQS